MSSYSQYYSRIIQAHQRGLKLVVGGTGLGKTRGAREVIQASPPTDPKSIYIANRKQLIEEMAAQLDPTTFVIVPRDLEAVQLTLRNHRAALYALLSDRAFKMYVDSYNAYNPWKVDIAAARQACRDLEEFSSRDPYIQRRLEEVMDGQARRVLDVFKAALLAAGGKRGNTSAYQDLIDHPVIQSLFSCIAFKRKPQVRLMLITLHKAFYGFFDGKKTLNLTGLQDEGSGYRIYLDEFDFLENDLVNLICRSREISDPFLFVELFYRTMARYKLPLEQYPFSVKPIRDRIVKITALIEQFEDQHLRFPELNHFTSLLPRDGGYKGKKGVRRTPAIFRTQHTISTNPLYLYQTERSFELVARPDPARGKPYSALRFFGTVSYACQLALSLFKDLEKEDPVIHREMVRQCFRGTDFPEQMARLSHYTRIDETPLTTRASLLEGGYSLYDIKDLQQITDREEVEVRHYGMSLTPETISEQQFRQLLGTLNHPDPWNNLYRSHADTRIDALYNDISTFIQALGRIERTWKETPDQTVLLSPEVDLRFQMFCSPAFDEVREGREAIISENLRQVFEQASARRSHIARQVRRDKDSRLWPQNEQCRSAIGQLLARIAGLRQGKGDQEARKLWEHLRVAALKHDFKDETLHRFACVADSPYYQKGLLVLTPQMDCLPPELRQHDSFPWDMNILYRTIRLNPVIFDHFKGEGYELSFDHPNKEFFTPYCYQAILAGAIGEEAIRALLLHEGISFEPMPDPLFEVADMKLAGRPWYVDSKHYSDWTMGRFALSPTDPAWHPKLNDEHFKRRAQEKLEAISSHHGEPGKLIYINLTSHYPRPLDYYTCDFRPAESFAEASIIVVQGALQQDAAALPQHAFEVFCRDLKRA